MLEGSYAPMTLPAHLPTDAEATRRYGKLDYIDLGVQWDTEGRLIATIRDSVNDLTPSTGTHLGSTSVPHTPSLLNASFSRQNSGVAANDSTAGHEDGSHFKRPLSPVADGEDEHTDAVEDDNAHVLKPFV
jgi:hypothetical protein